jgi:hypothetical protein
MATLAQDRKTRLERTANIEKRYSFIGKLIPRRCMLVSVGLILAGWSFPFLMAIHVLPVTMFLSFVGYTLASTGGVLALIFCGEI